MTMGTTTDTTIQSTSAQQLRTFGRRGLVFVFRFQSFFGLIIVFLLAIYISPVRADKIIFLSQRNLSNVARDVAETGILATGQILVILIAGIDLSVGSVVALTATTTALLLMRSQTVSLPLIGGIELSHLSAEESILLVLGLGLLIGWWNGWTSERFRIPSFVTTLAMLSIARGLAHIWSNNIAVPIAYKAGGADPSFEILHRRIYHEIIPVPALIMFGSAFIIGLVLKYTPFGRYIYAIGGNQTASRLSGLAVTRIKIVAFMLSGFFAAMAGIVHAAQLNQGSPNEAVGYELNAIAAVVIGGTSLMGGKGTIVGAIAGAFILGILNNMLSLNNVESNTQLVVKGLLVVGAVALQQFRPPEVE
jgi:ribose transport system permease protein